MIVTCPHAECGKTYNDARRWTICPHRSLDESPTTAETRLARCLNCGADYDYDNKSPMCPHLVSRPESLPPPLPDSVEVVGVVASHGRGQVLSIVDRVKPVDVTDNRKWTAETMLLELLEEIRSGKTVPVNLMLFFSTQDADGTLRPNTWFQNVTTTERIVYLNFGIAQAIDEWRS